MIKKLFYFGVICLGLGFVKGSVLERRFEKRFENEAGSVQFEDFVDDSINYIIIRENSVIRGVDVDLKRCKGVYNYGNLEINARYDLLNNDIYIEDIKRKQFIR